MRRAFYLLRAAVAAVFVAAITVCTPACDRDPARPDAVASEGNVASERWYAITMPQGKLGHARIIKRAIEIDGESLIETNSTLKMDVVRQGQRAAMQLDSTLVETASAALRTYERTMTQSGARSVVRAIVRGGELQIDEPGVGGATNRRFIVWPATALSPNGWEHMLSQLPNRPAETVTYRALDDATLQLADESLIYRGDEEIETPAGRQSLRRVDRTVRIPGSPVQTYRIYLAADGHWVKLEAEAAGFALLETTRDLAAAPAAKNVDLIGDMLVPVRAADGKAIPSSRTSTSAVYRIRVERGKPGELFAAGPTQAARAVDAQTIDLAIRSIRPGGTAPVVASFTFTDDKPPTAEMLAPSAMISSDDPAILAMVTAAVAGESDPAKRAVMLEKYVHGLIRQANYRNVFATASEAAKSREGDCSEFAVLLAAMLRANRIPARVAVGLVYLDRSQAFGFHMWTEAYLGGRWIPLDATLAGGGIGADHIKIGDTALTSGASDPVLLRVTDVLGAKPSITLQSVVNR